MNDDLEQRLRGLRPLPMPSAVRVRIAAAVRSAMPTPRARVNWLPALAAAGLMVAVLGVTQPVVTHQGHAVGDDAVVSYGLLMRHLAAPTELLQAIDQSRRPIPHFAPFDHQPSARNSP